MIKVDISLGREDYRVEVQNDCTGNPEVGNYNVQLIGPMVKYKPAHILRIRIEQFDRDRGFEGLLSEVFAKLEKERHTI